MHDLVSYIANMSFIPSDILIALVCGTLYTALLDMIASISDPDHSLLLAPKNVAVRPNHFWVPDSNLTTPSSIYNALKHWSHPFSQ
jgi:hypothetical protein